MQDIDERISRARYIEQVKNSFANDSERNSSYSDSSFCEQGKRHFALIKIIVAVMLIFAIFIAFSGDTFYEEMNIKSVMEKINNSEYYDMLLRKVGVAASYIKDICE